MRKSIVRLMIVALCFGGCSDFLAQRMVAPPNGNRSREAAAMTKPSTDSQELRIAVGPPEATAAVWVREPKGSGTPRGTIVLLHGILSAHYQVEGAARALRDAGYRTVLVDLRGHGESTGDFITYGVDDAHDLSQIVDYLQEKGLCGPSVGVFGTSYGAASAILFAGADARVRAVVAVAPFADLRDEAPHFGRYLVPIPGRFLSDADYTEIINKAGKLAGFDPDASSPLTAIARTNAHVRLFHGDLDVIIPCAASRQLSAANPERTELTIVPGAGHFALCFDLTGSLHAATREWFDRYLAEPAADAHQP